MFQSLEKDDEPLAFCFEPTAADHVMTKELWQMVNLNVKAPDINSRNFAAIMSFVAAYWHLIFNDTSRDWCGIMAGNGSLMESSTEAFKLHTVL